MRSSGDGSVTAGARVERRGDVVPAVPAWLVNLGAAAGAESGRLLRFALNAGTGSPAPGACNVRVVTARHAPALLLAPSGTE